jgi:O-antigen/teichoic acid export membrane protein
MTQTLLRTPGDVSLPPEQEQAGDAGLQLPLLVEGGSAEAPLPGHVTRRLIGGTSTLGFGVFLERGAGFLANLLAARFAGAATFGAYSLAISTANNISTYAAGGIGATASRFSGKYPQESAGYPTLARALAIVSLVSATLAATALWLGAAPIAHLLAKPALTGLLRWASLSSVGIILLECARGFFVGQRRLAALLLLSIVVGGGMLALLPIAAHSRNSNNAVGMVVVQGVITTCAVVLCLLLARPLGLHARNVHSTAKVLPLRPMLGEVWSFGLVQLAGLVGSNLAGLWLTTLIARSDTTLVQMSFFTIASQLRNLVGIAPGLLTEGSYAVMADPDGESSRTPHRVMALCSFASLTVALLLAAAGIVFIPWGLTLLYGRAYAPAGVTAAIALAIAVIHMGNAPAAARLTIVSIRAAGIINTVWAVFVAAAATLFLVFGGGAWQAMAIYFLAHMLSATLVLLTLHRRDHIPAGMSALFVFATSISAALAALAVWRGFRPALMLPITSTMFVLLLATAGGLYLFGRKYGWLPSAAALDPIKAGLRARLERRVRHV